MQLFKPRGTDGVWGGGKKNNLFIDTVVPEMLAVGKKRYSLQNGRKQMESINAIV